MAVLVAGCTVEQMQGPEPVTLFNREYYAVKILTRADIRKMKELMKSDDKSAAKTAGLILGRHYVRNGQLDEGYQLLKDNLDDSYLDRFTRISGHLWMYDAAQKKGDMETADSELGYINGIQMDDKADKAIRLYCAQEKREIIGGDVKSCVPANESGPEADAKIEIINEPAASKTPEQGEAPLLDKIVVKVKSEDADPQLLEAMLYSIGKLGVDVELDLTGEKLSHDYTLDLQTKIITSKTNMFEFGLNLGRTFEEAANLAMLNGGANIVLGYTPEVFEKAVEIENKYKGTNVHIYKFDVTDPNFQGTLKTVRQELGDTAAISFAVAGTEQQLVKVVPFLRFYSGKPDKTVIACAVTSLGKLFFNQEYIDYFRDAYVVTDVLLLGNTNIEHFNESYFNDYQKLPTVKDVLGYDLIVFMEKLKNPSFLVDYLTGIKSVDEEKTERDLEAYQIVSSNKLRKLVY